MTWYCSQIKLHFVHLMISWLKIDFYINMNTITYLIKFSNSLKISNKYKFYSLWFDPTRAQTYDLPYLRRASNHYTTDAVFMDGCEQTDVWMNERYRIIYIGILRYIQMYLPCTLKEYQFRKIKCPFIQCL
jgi:hypothetical protein